MKAWFYLLHPRPAWLYWKWWLAKWWILKGHRMNTNSRGLPLAWAWLLIVALLAIGAIALLSGCQESFHQSRTGWMDTKGPYAHSIIEVLDGTGYDIGALLNGEVSGSDVVFIRYLPDGTPAMEFRAAELSVDRDEAERIEGIVDSLSKRFDQLMRAIEAIAKPPVVVP